MRKSKIIQWNDKEVVCKELTVGEIRNLMEHPPEVIALDAIFFDRIPAAAIVLSTGLSEEDLSSVTPSSLDLLWGSVEEINPFFVQMLKRLAEHGLALEKSL